MDLSTISSLSKEGEITIHGIIDDPFSDVLGADFTSEHNTFIGTSSANNLVSVETAQLSEEELHDGSSFSAHPSDRELNRNNELSDSTRDMPESDSAMNDSLLLSKCYTNSSTTTWAIPTRSNATANVSLINPDPFNKHRHMHDAYYPSYRHGIRQRAVSPSNILPSSDGPQPSQAENLGAGRKRLVTNSIEQASLQGHRQRQSEQQDLRPPGGLDPKKWYCHVCHRESLETTLDGQIRVRCKYCGCRIFQKKRINTKATFLAR